MFEDNLDCAKGAFVAVLLNCSVLKFSVLNEELVNVRIGVAEVRVADQEFARRIAFWPGLDSSHSQLQFRSSLSERVPDVKL